MKKKELKLYDSERKKVLLERKSEALRQYKFIIDRHLKDDSGYKIDHCFRSNLEFFSNSIKEIDQLIEYYGFNEPDTYENFNFSDFTADDIPF